MASNGGSTPHSASIRFTRANSTWETISGRTRARPSLRPVARRGEHLGVEVARHDVVVARVERIGERHRDAVGLLSRGAARAPYTVGAGLAGSRLGMLG